MGARKCEHAIAEAKAKDLGSALTEILAWADGRPGARIRIDARDIETGESGPVHGIWLDLGAVRSAVVALTVVRVTEAIMCRESTESLTKAVSSGG